MPPLPRKASAFTLVELLVVIVILGALGFLLMPQMSRTVCGGSGQMTSILANARSLQIATTMMSLDTENSGGNGMDGTMLSTKGKTTPVSLAAYFDALVKNNYLTMPELKKLLTAPGIGPGPDAPTADNIAFRIFQFDHTAPADQPVIVTANWQDGHLTDHPPYGKKGFVYFTRGGDGGVKTRPTDAASPSIFPTGRDKAGHPYSTVTLE
jgi:prepilin-type N-terminal cleavage/methylation domain-containing protein